MKTTLNMRNDLLRIITRAAQLKGVSTSELVIDGPLFHKRINITKCATILKEGYWPHWFLDIQDYELI